MQFQHVGGPCSKTPTLGYSGVGGEDWERPDRSMTPDPASRVLGAQEGGVNRRSNSEMWAWTCASSIGSPMLYLR